jgi:hypothetical protein
MDHQDIMGILDIKIVDEVKNIQDIRTIIDVYERKHQEALILWERISEQNRKYITNQFNIWIGNDKKESDDKSDEEYKDNVTLNIPVKEMNLDGIVQKYKYVEESDKKKRKTTTSIYPSSEYKRLMEFISIEEINNCTYHDICSQAFKRCTNKGVFNIIWKSMKKKNYGNKSENIHLTVKYIFSDVTFSNRDKFKYAFQIAVSSINNIQTIYGIY